MKGNGYFRMKTSAPTIELDPSGHNSLAALMGRFRNEGQNQDYCLRAKPQTAGNSSNGLLGSKYCEIYDQGQGTPTGAYYTNTGRTHQVVNKENVWNNAPNPNESRYKQMTPTRRQQQPMFPEKRERSHSKSPINNSHYNDNSSSKFIFKAKENKTLGNLIQLAENYQQQNQYQKQGASPSKVFIGKKFSQNEENPSRRHHDESKPCIELEGEQLEKQVHALKETLAEISLQSLPREAVESAIHIQIEDFLNRLIPSRAPRESLPKFNKKESSVLMQTSQGMPVNFSFDISYRQQLSKAVTTQGESSERLEESEAEQINGVAVPQSDYLLCETGNEGGSLLTSKAEQMLRQL